MGTFHLRPLAEFVPLTITQKFVTGDYVHDFYCCAKFGGNPSIPEKIGEI